MGKNEYDEEYYEDEYYEDEYYEEEEEDSGKKKWLILLLLFLLLITIATSVFFGIKYFRNGSLTSDSNQVQDDGSREITDKDGELSDGGLPFDDPEKLREALQKKVDDSMLAIKINTNPVFNGPGSKGNLSIENSERNNYDFQVEITLDSNDEIVYTTPLMSPGQHILEDKLDKDLSVGEYEATAMFYAYNDNKELMGQAGAAITLSVKE